MFDPTAFDNMKVVIEGALYDLDLAGEIVISDRNDIVNMAKMSRRFDVKFHLSEKLGETVSAKIEIEANLINLAAELLPEQVSRNQNQSGCQIKLEFFLNGITQAEDLKNIQNILSDIWGDTRSIRQTIITHHSLSLITNVITVEFDRLISEDQIEDFVEMIDVMMLTIKKLQFYLNELETT
jgi:hypothetical protein